VVQRERLHRPTAGVGGFPGRLPDECQRRHYRAGSAQCVDPGSFLQRDYTQNGFDFFAHDTWQVTPGLALNFGVRYSYLGPLADQDHAITTFVPGKGIVGPGNGLDTLYQRDLNNFAPRAGFAWQPRRDGKTVVRGSYGIFYDAPAVAFFASNTGGGNGGAAGVNANPGGTIPVQSRPRPRDWYCETAWTRGRALPCRSSASCR